MNARPVYESEGDVARERAVIQRAGVLWNASPKKLPRSYQLDFALVRGVAIVAWVEVKVRPNLPAQKFPFYMVSLNKFTKGCDLARRTGKPFIFLVQFSESTLYYKHADEIAVPVEYRGRTDRGDWEDQEPCAMLPLQHFKPLAGATP